MTAYPPDHRHEPTQVLPTGAASGGRQAASERRIMVVAAIAGAVLAVGLGLGVAFMVTGGGDPRTAAPAHVPTASEEPVPSLYAQPSPAASPTAQPADLINALRATIGDLADADQIDDDASKELDEQLRDAVRALSRGDREKAWEKLSDFAGKVNDMHEEDELSDAALATIADRVNAITRVLPKA